MNHAYYESRRTRTLDVPRVVRSRGASVFAIQTIRYTTGEERIRRERRASSKVLYMSRMTGMTDAVAVRHSATYFAPDAANPRPAGRKDCSATEDAVILFFSSSSYIAMDIMETPLPTATPMPMSAPSEMMERDVYTD